MLIIRHALICDALNHLSSAVVTRTTCSRQANIWSCGASTLRSHCLHAHCYWDVPWGRCKQVYPSV